MHELNKFFINGEWVAPKSDRRLDIIDPSTEEVCGTVALGNEADVDAAVAAARGAFWDWFETPLEERLTCLRRLYDIYKARAEEMAQAMTTEMGAPIDFSRRNQVGAGLWHMKGFFKALEDFPFERDYTATEKHLLEPVGVAALITPWNWPMNQIVLKVFPAVAVGCTVILKPSEIAPISGNLFAEFMEEAGFPKGVFNLVHGDGAGVGTALSGHPGIDMVSFTGSTRAGRLITKNAAETIKRVTLELGGKGANIIFADADEKAVKRGVLHCMQNTGQSCNAPTRMLVERSRYAEAVEEAAAVAEKVAVGSAHEPGRHIGPLVSEAQWNKVQGLIQKGIEEGARLVAGGPGRPDGFNRGYFARPTVFADVSNDMTIAQEEIFGPVLSIIPFEDERQAVEIANDTVYGLTNYVQTRDDEKRRRVARRLRSGMVETNGIDLAMGSPFGGMKQSGNGREGGHHGLMDFCEVKAVSGWSMPE